MREIKLPGWDYGPVYFYETIDSTSDRLRELIEEGVPNGTVVWAGEQSRGRGRRGKNWFSPPGNLYFSIYFHSKGNIEPSFALVAGGAVIRALEKHQVVGLQLKWPNDILRNGLKVGGVLCENISGKIIVGIGLNLFPLEKKFEINGFSSGYLPELQGTQPDKLLGTILGELGKDFLVFIEKGFFFFREKLKNKSFLMNRNVQIDSLSGRVVDFGPAGQLVLELPDGSKSEIWQGSIVLMEEG